MPASRTAPPISPKMAVPPIVNKAADGTLHDFVQTYRHYRSPVAAARPLRLTVGTRTSPTYRLHGYWSKKPHEILAACIDTFTRPGDLVLDPFCGSGGTLLMASAAGRIGIGTDLSPAAAFISTTSLDLPSGERIKQLYSELLGRTGTQLEALYTTICHRCDGPADTRFTVTSDRYRCQACHRSFLAEDAMINRTAKSCPHCLQRLPRPYTREGQMPVEISAHCRRKCHTGPLRRRYDDSDPAARTAFHNFDLPLATNPGRKIPDCWFPTNPFPSGLKSGELFRRGIFEVHQLFSPRNLHALARLRTGIEAFGGNDHAVLLLIFTGALMSLSLKAQHLANGGGYLPAMYYVPPVRKERNPAYTLPRIVNRIANAADTLHSAKNFPSPSWTGIGNAIDLSPIPSESIDFVFLDPPYSDKIQFSELNLVWESWLGLAEDWSRDEIVLNPVRGKFSSEWVHRIQRLATEMHRVLKPGARTVITYTDSHSGTFQPLLNSFLAAGFDIVESTRHIQMAQSTFVQRTSPGAEKKHPLLVLSRN